MVPECFDRYKFDYIGRVLIGIAEVRQILNCLFPTGEKNRRALDGQNLFFELCPKPVIRAQPIPGV
jgi:hypothetical protein